MEARRCPIVSTLAERRCVARWMVLTVQNDGTDFQIASKAVNNPEFTRIFKNKNGSKSKQANRKESSKVVGKQRANFEGLYALCNYFS